MTECDHTPRKRRRCLTLSLQFEACSFIYFFTSIRKSAAARLGEQREADGAHERSTLCTPFSWVINETCKSFIITNVTFLKT